MISVFWASCLLYVRRKIRFKATRLANHHLVINYLFQLWHQPKMPNILSHFLSSYVDLLCILGFVLLFMG